jgi:hypothetical protein
MIPYIATECSIPSPLVVRCDRDYAYRLRHSIVHEELHGLAQVAVDVVEEIFRIAECPFWYANLQMEVEFINQIARKIKEGGGRREGIQCSLYEQLIELR